MRTRAILVACLVIVALVAPVTSVAAPLSQQVKVEITSPEMNAELRGTVSIIGSAAVPDFQFYKLEFGFGTNPAQWNVIGDLHYQAVVDGQLASWDTTVIPDGEYSVRLQGVKRDGNWVEFVLRRVVVANSRPSPTPTVDVTETPTRQATPTVSPTPAVTATARVIRGEEEVAVPTPTPTLSRPEQQNPLPFDPKSWGESFCFGGIAMAAVFVLLGIVLGLRRIL